MLKQSAKSKKSGFLYVTLYGGSFYGKGERANSHWTHIYVEGSLIKITTITCFSVVSYDPICCIQMLNWDMLSCVNTSNDE